MGTHGPGAAFWTPGIALMGVGIGVVFHLVVPGLDMEGRRTVSAGHTGTHKPAQTDKQRAQSQDIQVTRGKRVNI